MDLIRTFNIMGGGLVGGMLAMNGAVALLGDNPEAESCARKIVVNELCTANEMKQHVLTEVGKTNLGAGAVLLTMTGLYAGASRKRKLDQNNP